MSALHLGQLLTMGLPGPRLRPELRAFIRRVRPGGFILFGRNLESPEQVRTLCDELTELSGERVVLTIDQEGGRVSRLRKVGEEPPSAEMLFRAGRADWIEEHGRLTGQLLRMFGFNLNLAPVSDILLDPGTENSLMERCYGETPEQVRDNAGRFLRAMQAEGVLGTLKHFPGYSLCAKDPHRALPRVERTKEVLEAVELRVFRELMGETDAVMVGHAVYPGLGEPEVPSSLSRRIVKDLLREEMGYGGMVVTDDLEMGAIANEYGVGDAVRRAMEAGNDLLLFCHQRECVEMALEVLQGLPDLTVTPALERMAAFRERLQPPHPWDRARYDAITASIGRLRHAVLAG